jgi:hypothetical protein
MMDVRGHSAPPFARTSKPVVGAPCEAATRWVLFKLVVLLVVRAADECGPDGLSGRFRIQNLEPTAGFEPATRCLQIRICTVRSVPTSATSAVLYSAPENFVPISIDKCRLVVTSLVVFWWYDLSHRSWLSVASTFVTYRTPLTGSMATAPIIAQIPAAA